MDHGRPEERPYIDRAALLRVRRYMDAAIPDCLVTGYDDLIDGLCLPDPNDRHVVAAAIVGRASCIVTFDQADFPDDILDRYGLHTRHPDRFLLDLDSIDPGTLIVAAKADRLHYRSPPLTVDDYIDGLRRGGLVETADYLTRMKVLLEP